MKDQSELPETLRVALPVWISLYFCERFSKELELEQELDALAKPPDPILAIPTATPRVQVGMSTRGHVDSLLGGRMTSRDGRNVPANHLDPCHTSWGLESDYFSFPSEKYSVFDTLRGAEYGWREEGRTR
jgi:hypothetical protein